MKLAEKQSDIVLPIGPGQLIIPRGSRKDEAIRCRLTAEEKDFFQSIADAKNMSMSDLILSCMYSSLKIQKNKRRKSC